MPGCHKNLLLLGFCALLLGCASTPANLQPPTRIQSGLNAVVSDCEMLFASLDVEVERQQVADVQSQRVPGYRYLRVNRFLEAVAPAATSKAAFDVWVRQLRELDRQARAAELANLDVKQPRPETAARLDDCAERLAQHDFGIAAGRTHLRAVARVDDAYDTSKRLLGFYALTAIPMHYGVSRLVADTDSKFRQPLASRRIHGELVRLVPPEDTVRWDTAAVAAALDASADNALELPLPSDVVLEALFQTFAPIWEVDVATHADRLGAPGFHDGGLWVDVEHPVVYTLTSHTLFEGKALLQLNYIVWFPERTSRGGFDLLAGKLDGITWRVTLGSDGRPLHYDAMHNCGCYYMAFPTETLARRPMDAREEPMSVPQLISSTSERLVIRVASHTHYLERVYGFDDGPELRLARYELGSYDELRSMADKHGRRSLFGSDGLVAGTQRGERWLFWPMGVADPGTMRQWGHHAIAFVGRRHFDQADLIERYFRRQSP